jgi:hypothetical protein
VTFLKLSKNQGRLFTPQSRLPAGLPRVPQDEFISPRINPAARIVVTP